MKRAFTLIELLVVIGILGVLTAVLMGTFSGSTESARAARCLTNMRNLAGAVQSYAMANSYYPPAGTGVIRTRKTGTKKRGYTYRYLRGWISWNTGNSSSSDSIIGSSSMNISTYEINDTARDNAITNGALWKYVSGNRSVYVCPTHLQQKKNLNPLWSYVMNGYFGWTASPGTEESTVSTVWNYEQRYAGFPRSDRYLLFAELPFSTKLHTGSGSTLPATETTSAGTSCDCTLQYDGLDGASDYEIIGFNHTASKRMCAHVAFADGHCEKLLYPQSGMSISTAQELTKWLCTGVDVSFDGKKYDNASAEN